MGAACCRAASTSLLFLACVTAAVFSGMLGQLVPCRTSEAGMKMCWERWMQSPAELAKCYFASLQSEEGKKRMSSVRLSLYIAYFLPSSWRPLMLHLQQSRERAELPSLGVEMICRNATTQPKDCRGCPQWDRTPRMFREGKSQLWRFFLLQWINSPFRSKILELSGAGFHFSTKHRLDPKKVYFHFISRSSCFQFFCLTLETFPAKPWL